MIQNKGKSLVEVCPRCCKSVDSYETRLVQDACGHLKCRICLLQEITGCLLCATEAKSTAREQKGESNFVQFHKLVPQQRKSVITSAAIQKAEETQSKDIQPVFLSPSSEEDTCHLIKQSLEKDILFPTEIVKRSTGNFYHLKRIFSQRFFNEDNNKKHKACETDEKWSVQSTEEKNDNINSQTSIKKNSKLPPHIKVQYYCKIHRFVIEEKSKVLSHHMTCLTEGQKDEVLLYKCKICDKSYKIKGKLNRHLKTHSKNSNFKCAKCDKLCVDNYALKMHEKTHNQQKPYTCKYCHKSISSLQNIKRHEKIHRNEKKFVCNDCGFRFITKTELKRHSTTHSHAKSFVCSLCSKKFTFKRTLVRHLKMHDANLLKLKCPKCESTFRRKDNLERHLKTAHFEIKIERNENEEN